MKKIIRLGDYVYHDGRPVGGVITASSNVFSSGLRVARIGDFATCKEHGTCAIVMGSPTTFNQGRAVAREGDRTSCGGILRSRDLNTKTQ